MESEAIKLKVEEIEISKISYSPLNVREVKIDSDIENLANSIKENGLLQPIVVRLKSDSNYELIAGQRRLVACKNDILKWSTIPCVIIEKADDLKVLTLSTVENLQRLDLNKAEKMEAFSRIFNMYNEDIKQVGIATGYSLKTVQLHLDLDKGLDPSIKEEIKKEQRDVSITVLEHIIKNKNISINDQRELLDHAGSRSTKDVVDKIKSITNLEKKRDVIDEFKGEKAIRELIDIFFSFKNRV